MRASGILLHITSLPGNCGVGTLGDVDGFIDFLRESKQTYWQVLPITPTDFVNSPYASPSAFAGNTLLIDSGELVRDGLLDEHTALCGSKARGNDYGYAVYHKDIILREAYSNFLKINPPSDYAEFRSANHYWLPDYALFCAVKRHFNGKSWLEWDDESIRMRTPAALHKYRDLLEYEIGYIEFCQ